MFLKQGRQPEVPKVLRQTSSLLHLLTALLNHLHFHQRFAFLGIFFFSFYLTNCTVSTLLRSSSSWGGGWLAVSLYQLNISHIKGSTSYPNTRATVELHTLYCPSSNTIARNICRRIPHVGLAATQMRQPPSAFTITMTFRSISFMLLPNTCQVFSQMIKYHTSAPLGNCGR